MKNNICFKKVLSGYLILLLGMLFFSPALQADWDFLDYASEDMCGTNATVEFESETAGNRVYIKATLELESPNKITLFSVQADLRVFCNSDWEHTYSNLPWRFRMDNGETTSSQESRWGSSMDRDDYCYARIDILELDCY